MTLGVPVAGSILHSSEPLVGVEAWKYSVPLTLVKLLGHELLPPELMSIRTGFPVVLLMR